VSQTGLRTDKVHAPLTVLSVKVIVGWDFNWQTVWMSSASIATLWSLASSLILSFCTQGDVVIDELTPGDQEDGDSVIVESVIWMDV